MALITVIEGKVAFGQWRSQDFPRGFWFSSVIQFS
jgi:hypothetical protein